MDRHDSSVVIWMMSITLFGCGGGGSGVGGDSTAVASNNCGASGVAFAIVSDQEVEVGKAAGAAIIGCTTAVNNPIWSINPAPSAPPLASKSQAIGFDVANAGSYQVSVTFSDDAGRRQQASTTINTVAKKNPSFIVARLDQAVRKGGQLSIHAWESVAPGDSVKRISWQQIDGPNAVTDMSNSNRLLVKAPEVSQDSIIKFRVTLETNLGTIDSDDVAVLVQNFKQADPADATAIFRNNHVSAVFPYIPTSPYANDLVPCTYTPELRGASPAVSANFCPLSRLTFIAQETAGGLPTVEQIMNRVVVSHEWMGQVFEQFLRTQDTSGDIKRMLNGVTAIVIGTHIRPSFYYSVTGAIYLDARSFWLTPEQRDSIDETPDPRSTNGDSLMFTRATWYTSGNALASTPISVTSRASRSLSDLLSPLASLLYHELTHANDYLPPRLYSALNSGKSAWDNLSGFRALNSSTLLVSNSPLQSTILTSIAEVLFKAKVPTAIEAQYTPQQIANFFLADRATDLYSYSSQYEDTAVMTEEFLMNYRHSFRRNVAVLDGAPTIQPTIVRWGLRGRIGEATIKPRLKQFLSSSLPWINPAAVDALPAPVSMRPGDTVVQNYVLGP